MDLEVSEPFERVVVEAILMGCMKGKDARDALFRRFGNVLSRRHTREFIRESSWVDEVKSKLTQKLNQ